MLNPFETEERRAFQDNVRKFMESEINPYVDEWDEAGGYPHEVNEKVCKLGVFGFDIPEEYGGRHILREYQNRKRRACRLSH